MPDPIEAHLAAQLTHELAEVGVCNARVGVLSADSANWRYRVTAGDREFEMGFNHREQLWCREVTVGAEKPLTSNDGPRVGDGTIARRIAVALIQRTLSDAGFPPRDPPII